MSQSISIRTGFQPIKHNISFDKQKVVKGEDLAKNHVKRVEELRAIGACKLIRTNCVRSLKYGKPPYTVQLDLDESRMVTRASCSCVSGLAAKCKHVYGVIHYVNTDRSKTKTATEQGWDMPSPLQLGKAMYAKPLVLADKFIPNNNFSNVEPYNLTLEDLEGIDCPLRNILKVENMKREDLEAKAKAKIDETKAKEQQLKLELQHCIMSLIEMAPRQDELYWNNRGELEPCVKDFFDTKIKVKHHQVFETCVNTVNQSKCNLWFEVRYSRISASSKAHKIKTRTRKLIDDLANDFLLTETKKSSPAMEYGNKHEKRAVREYAQVYNKVVRHIGVFIMPLQPWLCCSPDGIVIEDDGTLKILEIKCPATCKSKPIYDEGEKKLNVGYLSLNNGQIHLKASHEYYTQCQILMYVTGLKECDLYVWSPKGSVLVSVERDDNYLKTNVPKIEEFYFKAFLPKLINMNKENSRNSN